MKNNINVVLGEIFKWLNLDNISINVDNKITNKTILKSQFEKKTKDINSASFYLDLFQKE